MEIALYDSAQDNVPKHRNVAWAELGDLLRSPRRTECAPCLGHHCPEKNGPAWSPVEIGDRRRNADVRSVTALVFDVDGLQPKDRGTVDDIDQLGNSLYLHSTHSHSPDRISLRLIFQLSRSLSVAEYSACRASVLASLKIPADPAAKDLARLFFLPSCPTDSEFLFASLDGAPLDVDHYLRSTIRTLSTHSLGSKPDSVNSGGMSGAERSIGGGADGDSLGVLNGERSIGAGAEIDLGALRIKLRNKPRMNELLRGDPLAQEGGRDTAIQSVVSILAFTLRDASTETLLHILRPSLAKMAGDEGLDHWLAVAEEKIERARRQLQEKEEIRSLAKMNAARSLIRESVAIEKDDQTEEQITAEKYPDDLLELWVRNHGCETIEDFQKRWIIQHDSAFYVFAEGQYRKPVTRHALLTSLPRDLARAPIILAREDDFGNRKPYSFLQVLDTYATAARQVAASLSLQRSFYDPESQTFHEAVCPIRRIPPVEHPDIGTWLRMLGGTESSRFLDWIATASRLDRQTCAVILSGVKGVGKNLFAFGLSRLWASAPSELGRILEGFNDSLTTCPLVFCDERLPNIEGITATLRSIIGSTSRTLSRKFLPNCSLEGSIRLIIAGNNDRLLETGEDLGGDDLDAVSERFLFLQPDPLATDYLQSLGGAPVLETWITEDKIAQHALWLRENRQITEGARFLVEGNPTEFHARLAVSSRIAGAVTEWITHYLSSPTMPTSNKVRFGMGSLLVNTGAMASEASWKNRVPSQKVPPVAQISRALRNLSTGTVEIEGLTFHQIRVDLLLQWAERNQVANLDLVRERIGGFQ